MKRFTTGIFWFSVFVLGVGVIALSGTNKLLPGKNNSTSVKTILESTILQEESAVINVVDAVSPSVVSVVVTTTGFDTFTGPFSIEDGIGTGFVVDDSGIIVTNSHVVEFTDADYSVVLADGRTYVAEDISRDPTTDLALIKINPDGEDLPAVELGHSDSLKVGQVAIAIGNALGKFDNTVTVGVVSGVARELSASSGIGSSTTYENAIQTDAALNPGNSGGPLLNSQGQVIGINVATTRGADNISFAIPVDTLKPLLQSYLAEGRIIKPYIGISYQVVTPDIARLRRLPEGAFISEVLPDSPADEAGIRRGDIIIKINGEDINEEYSVASVIRNSAVGDVLSVTLDRDGENVTVDVTLDEMPQNYLN